MLRFSRWSGLAAIALTLVFSPITHAAEDKAKKVEPLVLKWVGCGITKKAFMKEVAAAYKKKTGIEIDIQGGGATRGIRETAAGRSDFGGACRYKIEGHPEEARAMLKPVAWDALVVIVHKDNPVEDITLDQIRGLYLGKIKNWKELGGKDAPIKLYARKGKNSGVGRALRKLVFANFDQEFVASEFVKSSGPLEKAVVKDINAVGVTGISSARKRDVKNLKLEGKSPDYENIKNGTYLLYRPLYLAFNFRGPNAKYVDDFYEFIHTSEGREILRKNGTVPYLDALQLVMKQIEQERRAAESGIYRK